MPTGCTPPPSIFCAACDSRMLPPEKVRRALSALSVLVFGGPKTLGELAAAEQVKPPTMSRIVAGLVRSRLVHVDRRPEDARRMHIRPTKKGIKLLQKGRQLRIDYLASRLERLSTEELGRSGKSCGNPEKKSHQLGLILP